MARLPVYTAQQGIDAPGAPSIPDQGAVGRALSGAGSAIQQVGGQLSDLDVRYAQLQKQKETFATANNTDAFKAQQNGQLQTDLQNAPPDGSNFAMTTLQRYDKDAETYVSTVPADQQERTRSELALYRQNLLNTASGKEHEISNAYSMNTLKDNYTSTLNAVNANPAQRDVLLAGLKQRIDMAPSLEPAQREDVYRNAVQGVALQYVKALAGPDPDKVRQLQGMPPRQQGNSGSLPTGPAPGASGYGAINAPYKAPLNKPGEGGHVAPVQMYAYLKSQGATDNEALMLTGAAASESSFNPNAVHDGGSGHGLFGHNDGRLDMRGKDWQQQSAAALQELRSRPEASAVNGAKTPEELATAQMFFERPRGFSSNNPRAGDNYTGRLNTIRYFSQMKNGSDNLPPYAEAGLSESNANQSPAPGGAQTGAAPGNHAYTPTTDPVLSTLSPDQWDSLYNSARAEQTQNQAVARASLEPRVQDATAAFLATGRYSGQVPTQQDFTQAYGAADGSERYAQFQRVQQVGAKVDSMKTSTPIEMQAMVDAAKPVDSGPGFAVQQQTYEALQQAAAANQKARTADSVAYVRQVSPAIDTKWKNATTPAGIQDAIAATSAFQQQIGIPIQDRKVLPDSIVSNTMGQFNIPDQGADKQLQTLSSLVFSTSDPAQQAAIFDQLKKAGVPAEAEGAIRAFARGDTGDARLLMTAATAKDLPAKINNTAPSAITQAIDTAMGAGSVGTTLYGVDAGSLDNLPRYQADRSLLSNAVKLKMLEGKDVATATAEATKALYGDLRVVDQGNAKIVVSAKQNADDIVHGLSLQDDKIKAALATFGEVSAPTDTAAQRREQTFTKLDIQNRTNDLINTGTWRNLGNGYGFFDNTTGMFVAGKDGQPLIVNDADISGSLTSKTAQINSQLPVPVPGNRAAGTAPAPGDIRAAIVNSGRNAPSAPAAPTSVPAIPPPPKPSGGVPTSGNDAFQQQKDIFQSGAGDGWGGSGVGM